MSQFSVNVYPPPAITVDVAPPSTLSVDVVAGPIVTGGGGGGGATNLDGLTDVVITSPISGQLLRFDGTNWVNATLDSVLTTESYANPSWITSLAWSKLTGVPSTFAPSAHVHSWSDITTGKPTTLAGYGITDAAPSAHVHSWSDITTGRPTTLAGYGITDAQPLDSDLSAIAALATTAFGRSILTQADGPAVRGLIGAGTSSFDGTYLSLSGRPSTFAPSAHASSHQSGGADAIKLDDLAAPDDNTDLDATTTRHGLLPKLSGGTSTYLRGDGSWATPSGGGGGGGVSAEFAIAMAVAL